MAGSIYLMVRGHPWIGGQLLHPAEDVVGLHVIVRHDEGLKVAGELLSVLRDAKGVQDEVHEGLQVRHAFVFCNELELDAAKVAVAHILDAFCEAYRSTDLDSARRLQHVEVATNDVVSEHAHL